MVYTLPISKEDILAMTKDYLQSDDTTWVDGQVYFNEKDYRIQFHINEKKEIITLCIPTVNIYLEYYMNTYKLKSIIYTNTNWSDDWIRYDFDNENLYYIEVRSYGHSRRAYINVKDNVVTNVEIDSAKSFGTYKEGYVFELDRDFKMIFTIFNDYF